VQGIIPCPAGGELAFNDGEDSFLNNQMMSRWRYLVTLECWRSAPLTRRRGDTLEHGCERGISALTTCKQALFSAIFTRIYAAANNHSSPISKSIFKLIANEARMQFGFGVRPSFCCALWCCARVSANYEI